MSVIGVRDFLRFTLAATLQSSTNFTDIVSFDVMGLGMMGLKQAPVKMIKNKNIPLSEPPDPLPQGNFGHLILKFIVVSPLRAQN